MTSNRSTSQPPPSDRQFLDDLDDAIFSFREIQAEMNYKQAQDSLRSLVGHFDLTARERTGLENDLDRLTRMLDKLDRAVVQIAAFGLVGRGKSSLLNALVGREVFEVGPLHGVTREIDSADWHLTQEPLERGDRSILRATFPSIGHSQIQLIDTPGIDEVDGRTREILARQVAERADLILFIIAGDLTKVEYNALKRLREVGKPMLLVFNKIDQYPEADRLAIYSKIRDERVRQLLSPEEIVMVAAAPSAIVATRKKDGSIKSQRRPSSPQIQELKLKILDILHREGKSLVALNTMLYANEVNEKVLERKLTLRDRAADSLIGRGVTIKATAVALNPVTAVDLLTGATIDVALIVSLSQLYGLPMTHASAVNLLQKIALSMGGIGASELLAALGLSGLKGLLGLSVPATVGGAIGPYVSVAIAQASVAGVSTYAIARAAKTYLANGASWGPDGPKAVVARILDSLDETSILNRIKEELSAKLGR
ncbi:MAG: GTP-binding protein [Cyanobacteriota bacterium]|nr:GTP-binding protein [Cyanobacteriota bacterium]